MEKFEEMLAKASENKSMNGSWNYETYQKYKGLKAEIAALKAKEKTTNANDLAAIRHECIEKNVP